MDPIFLPSEAHVTALCTPNKHCNVAGCAPAVGEHHVLVHLRQAEVVAQFHEPQNVRMAAIIHNLGIFIAYTLFYILYK